MSIIFKENQVLRDKRFIEVELDSEFLWEMELRFFYEQLLFGMFLGMMFCLIRGIF